LKTNGFEDIDTLFVLNLIDKELHKIVIPSDFLNKIWKNSQKLLPGDRFRLDGLSWATNSDVLWGIITQTCSVLGMFSYDCANNQLETFLAPNDIGDGYSINPNTGILVYSTFPFLFDVESEQAFIASKKEVKMIRYEIRTQKKQLIETSISKPFNPQWICQDTLECSDPKTASRKRISLLDREK
jgi:hypothetical protein